MIVIDSTLEEQDSANISYSKCGALGSDDEVVSVLKFESSSRTTVQSCKIYNFSEYHLAKEGNIILK